MKREGNFEAMRTLAMFFIVVYHCLTHGVGGVYAFPVDEAASLTNVVFSDLLLVFSSIAVNLYVLVSGYFLCDISFKFSRILRTWVNTCFYSCTILLLMMVLSVVPFSFTTLVKSLLPLSTDAYWFVTQYIGMLILSPFLSMLVRHMNYRQFMGLLVGGAFLCLSIIPDFPLAKRFHVAHGNSVWSFAYLFMVAAFIRHHLGKVALAKLVATICLLILLIFGVEIVCGIQHGVLHLYWLDYNGLTALLAIAVFVYFRQLSIPDTWFWNVIVKIAPYTFGVYLLHDHLVMRNWLWQTFSLSDFGHQLGYIPAVIGLCLLIFTTGVLVDFAKKNLFVFCQVDSIIEKVDSWLLQSKFLAKFGGK